MTDYFKLKFPNPVPFGQGRVKSLWFRIKGFKIVPPSVGYTDFFGEGATFDVRPAHVADIQLPPTGKTALPMVYTTVTRYQHYDAQLMLLTPLWDGPADREHAIARMRAAWTLPEDVRAADKYFEHMENQTLSRLARRATHDPSTAPPRPPTPASPPLNDGEPNGAMSPRQQQDAVAEEPGHRAPSTREEFLASHRLLHGTTAPNGHCVIASVAIVLKMMRNGNAFRPTEQDKRALLDMRRGMLAVGRNVAFRAVVVEEQLLTDSEYERDMAAQQHVVDHLDSYPDGLPCSRCCRCSPPHADAALPARHAVSAELGALPELPLCVAVLLSLEPLELGALPELPLPVPVLLSSVPLVK
eukprot:jgi/Tetstr1/424995/TSEL_015465.t2